MGIWKRFGDDGFGNAVDGGYFRVLGRSKLVEPAVYVDEPLAVQSPAAYALPSA